MKIKYSYIALFISILIIGFLIKDLRDTKTRLGTMTNNFQELNTLHSTLRLTNGELRTYIHKLDTKHKQEIDSILKDHKVKISRLKSYQSIKTEIVYRDTSRVMPIKVKPINSTKYRMDFLKTSKCITVSGHLNTLDRNTEIYIDSMKAVNTVYITRSYKKNFWDYIFFRRGREITKTTSDCGNVSSNLVLVND